MEQEIWKDIEGFEGLYLISNKGRIKSLPKVRNYRHGKNIKKEKILKNYIAKNGYATVTLCNILFKKKFTVHRLLAKAFIPNPNKKMEINHINGIRNDYRLENLEWVTRKENAIHCQRFLNPKRVKGEDIASSKLTHKLAKEIRTKYSKGNITYKELAVEYNVSDRSIGGVITGKYWKNISNS